MYGLYFYITVLSVSLFFTCMQLLSYKTFLHC